MLIKVRQLLMDKATEHGSASGYGADDTQNNQDSKAAGDSGDASKDKAATQGESDKAAGADDKSKQAAASTESKDKKVDDDKKSASGYAEGDADDKTKDQKKEDEKSGEAAGDFSKLDLKGMDDNQSKDIIEFAKSEGLTPKQAQSLLDKRKAALDDITKQQSELDVKRKDLHKTWTTELQNDPEFGGANFKQNVAAVDKFMATHMPGLTKKLTESGKRLSPVEMKEFFALAKKMGDEGTFESGSGNSAGQSKERRPWDNYNNS